MGSALFSKLHSYRDGFRKILNIKVCSVCCPNWKGFADKQSLKKLKHRKCYPQNFFNATFAKLHFQTALWSSIPLESILLALCQLQEHSTSLFNLGLFWSLKVSVWSMYWTYIWRGLQKSYLDKVGCSEVFSDRWLGSYQNEFLHKFTITLYWRKV